MPDVTMCANNKCILKKSCYRHEAISNLNNQSYCHFESNTITNKCEYFIPFIEKKSINEKLDFKQI